MAEAPNEPTLQIIIAYKCVRAAAALLAAGAILTLKMTGHAEAFGAFAEDLRDHATSGWSIALARAMITAATPHHLWLVAGALAIDGAFTAVEGWALHHGAVWGEWLVVVATCGFIPFEIRALVHHVSVTRAVVLILNVAIVVYLARRARNQTRERLR